MAPSRHHPNHIFLTFLAKNQILLVKSREMRCLPTSYHNRIFVGFSPESSGATYQNCRFLEFWAGDRILGTLATPKCCYDCQTNNWKTTTWRTPPTSNKNKTISTPSCKMSDHIKSIHDLNPEKVLKKETLRKEIKSEPNKSIKK